MRPLLYGSGACGKSDDESTVTDANTETTSDPESSAGSDEGENATAPSGDAVRSATLTSPRSALTPIALARAGPEARFGPIHS